MKLNHPEFTFTCFHRDCIASFTTAEDLTKHKEIHGKMPCPTCGKLLKSGRMAKHIQFIHNEPREKDTRVVCDLCGKVSTTRYTHRYHIKTVHEVHVRLQCDICKEW